MKATSSRKAKRAEKWPRKVQPGRSIVTVYRRRNPSGNWNFMVANYADGERRRFDSYNIEADALDAADALARRLDARDYISAAMTKDQAIEFANAQQTLQPLGLTLTSSITTAAEAVKIVGDLASVIAACKFYKARNKQVTPKRVADVVEELIKVKASRDASERYLRDLRGRLTKFAEAFQTDISNVSSGQIQEWLDSMKTPDGQKMTSGTYAHIKQKLFLLFSFAVTRHYCVDNPIENVEAVKIKRADIEIFTVEEISRLLAAASPDFLPSLVLGAFAGLRSAEVERLEWSDIDLRRKHIILSASKAKTASRRIVPIADNLAAWLTPYVGRKGKVWAGGWLYSMQQECAAATEVKADDAKGIKAQAPVKWKQNALRHSYVSYRLAQTQNAAQVALECGNSPQMIFKHYRELVTTAAAQAWFAISPKQPANVVQMTEKAIAS